MASGEQAGVLEGVRRIFEGGTVAALGSESLLRRFAATGDESAFAAIVARHGPMVFAVCQRALRDPRDVEDAFQATFLVFLRRAGSIRDGEGLGGWFHGVARRVATRSRAVGARRRSTEIQGVAFEPASPAVDPDRDELAAVVDEEIGRLPERYRRAIVLCDLEGCAQPEAAARLGWSEGSLRGRLARGREMLRSRLRRRGLVAPAGATAGLVATDVTSAGRLGEALVRARMAGAGVEGASAAAVAQAKETLTMMVREKVRAILLGAVAVGVMVSGVGVGLARGLEGDDARKPAPGRGAATPHPDPEHTRDFPGLAAPIALRDLVNPPEPEPADTHRIAVGDVLIVEALEAYPGRPITGERLVRPDGTISLQWYGDVPVVGLTRREAKVRIIELLRQYLRDESLGLVAWNDEDQKYVLVHPARSSRVFVDESPTYDTRRRSQPAPDRDVARTRTPAEASPRPRPVPGPAGVKAATVKAGDRLVVDVLEALPGRPLSGERLVRPDGTIGLGFYSDLKVAGLTRDEVKVKAIEHLRQWLSDEALGLVVIGKDGTSARVAPERSTRVFVDESDGYHALAKARNGDRIDALERKLDRVLDELEALRKERSR